MTHPETVRDAVARCSITKKEISERSGIPVHLFRHMNKPDWDPRWSVLQAACIAIEEIKRERA